MASRGWRAPAPVLVLVLVRALVLVTVPEAVLEFVEICWSRLAPVVEFVEIR